MQLKLIIFFFNLMPFIVSENPLNVTVSSEISKRFQNYRSRKSVLLCLLKKKKKKRLARLQNPHCVLSTDNK